MKVTKEEIMKVYEKLNIEQKLTISRIAQALEQLNKETKKQA